MSNSLLPSLGLVLAISTLAACDNSSSQNQKKQNEAGKVVKNTEKAIPSLNVRTADISAINEDISSFTSVPMKTTLNEGNAFSMRLNSQVMFFYKENCTQEDKPYYFIIHIFPEDPKDLQNPEAGFNNEDMLPTYFQKGRECYMVTYPPNYRVKSIKIGQYERSYGSRWSAIITGEDFNNINPLIRD